MSQLIYDGTFEGLLSVINYIRDSGIDDYSIINRKVHKTFQLYIDSVEIESDFVKSEILYGEIFDFFDKIILENIFFTFLADSLEIDDILCKFILKSLNREINPYDIRQSVVADVNKYTAFVKRERHKIYGFIRFSELEDGKFYSVINPKCNLLPIIGKHFVNRFRNEDWYIYDEVRKSALVYCGGKLTLEDVLQCDPVKYSVDEEHYQILWKKFFDTIAIENRLSYKRQRGHVPLYYRKNMAEFC